MEFAGEIAVDFPQKKVTLVHGGSRLLQFVGPKASDKALTWLTSKKVEVLLGQSIDLSAVSESDRVFKTSAGETIHADCFFNCTGTPLGSSWLRETFLKSCLDMHGRLMVDEHLRVRGKQNVFAVGDVTDVKVRKDSLFLYLLAFLSTFLRAFGERERECKHRSLGDRFDCLLRNFPFL